jgi:hypothetical protein
MAYPLMVDARNLFDPAAAAASGFLYHPTGRPFVEGDRAWPPA